MVPVVLLAIAAAAIVVFAVRAVGSSGSGTTTARTQLATVRRGVVQTTVAGTGNLAPANESDLSFGASGRVTKILVTAGEHVSAGQVLAEVDPSDAQVTLAQAKATEQSARDTYDAATSTTLAAAKASLTSATLAVTSARSALAQTKLRAPIAATVATVSGAVGDEESASSSASASSSGTTGAGGSSAAGAASGTAAASATSASFITLAQVSRYKLSVTLTESDIGSVKVGQRATVTVNAADSKEFAAHVSAVDLLSSSSSSSSGSSSAVSYPVELTLDQASPELRAGMSASAAIITASDTGISVPTAAIQNGSVSVERNGKRSTVRVQTGVAGDSSTIVTSGLNVGDQVLVTSTSAAAGAASSGSAATQSGAGTRNGTAGGLGSALGGGGAAGGGRFSGGNFGGGGSFGGGPGGAP